MPTYISLTSGGRTGLFDLCSRRKESPQGWCGVLARGEGWKGCECGRGKGRCRPAVRGAWGLQARLSQAGLSLCSLPSDVGLKSPVSTRERHTSFSGPWGRASGFSLSWLREGAAAQESHQSPCAAPGSLPRMHLLWKRWFYRC